VATCLKDYENQLRALAGELAGIGFMSQGSVVCRYTRCGKPGCRCQQDPPQPHGPYWQWSRAVGGKTLTRRITEEQAAIYKEWIANRRRALRIIAEIERISRQAGEIVLGDGSEPAPRQVP
jgi:hypothetical protein